MSENDDPKKRYARIAAACTLFNTRRAARVMTDLYEAVLAPSGVPATSFPLLVALRQNEPVSISALAHGTQTDRTTLTRTLKPLEENGWIETVPGKDRRVRILRLTQAGNDALERALPRWEKAQTLVQAQLGQENWQALIGHLQAASALTKP